VQILAGQKTLIARLCVRYSSSKRLSWELNSKHGKANMKSMWRVAIIFSAVAVIGGCAQLGYYVQAAQGQFALLSSARPIDEWLSRPDVDEGLKGKLTKVKSIRAFAARELALPDNQSYTTYADLKRPYVMWNVVATPELSLKPAQWCFPVAGCVTYRGYYSKGAAQAYAAELRAKRYDVDVSGVPAYSTLGWFDDPVLSTFIQYPDVLLARLVFHELAHQVVYVGGDSRFNESFAVAVEEAGVARWLELRGSDDMRRAYAAYQNRKKDFIHLLMKHRNALETNYARDVSDEEKRREKAAIFQSLQNEYQQLKASWGGYAGYDKWFSEPLSNAHLSAVATYHDHVPGFRALLAQHRSLDKFYNAVRELAILGEKERNERLANLGSVMPPDSEYALADALP
jgi:predicted aminopeptidase